MKVKQIDILILVFVVLAIISLNYSPVDTFLEETFSPGTEVFVERVIDGDTIESDIGNVRFLGINTPERGERYYNEARDFLKKRIENKTVKLEFVGEVHDKYGRILAYVFLDNKNINVELVEKGFANYYFYGKKDRYSEDLEEAWEICLDNNVNLCEKSKDICEGCIYVNINSIVNNCNFDCNISNWKIKGEGREKVVFNSTLEPGEMASFELDLTDSSGSIFLWDSYGRLVEWKS